MKTRIALASLILAISIPAFAFDLEIDNNTGKILTVGDINYCSLQDNISIGKTHYNNAPYNCATTIAGLSIQFYGNSIKTRCNLWWCISASYYNGVLTLSN